MERKKLLRQLRRVQRLGRYYRSVGDRLSRLRAELGVTDGELEVLVQQNDGYLLVADARREEKHVTLSDADEISLRRAREREEKRAAQRAAQRRVRDKQLEDEKEQRKLARISKRKRELEAILEELKINQEPSSGGQT